MRPILALLAAAAAGVVGALVLGEYAIDGVVGVAAGAVFGLLVGEVVLGVAGAGTSRLAGAAAAAAAGGVIGAAWISTSGDLGRFEPEGWLAAALAGAAAGFRARPPRRAGRTSPASAPGP